MENHQIYQSFNFCEIVLFKHLKMFSKLSFLSWLSYNPIYFFISLLLKQSA